MSLKYESDVINHPVNLRKEFKMKDIVWYCGQYLITLFCLLSIHLFTHERILQQQPYTRNHATNLEKAIR